MRVAAIIPAWNEEGAIGGTIARLPRPLIGAVIVVDGGSTDGTVTEARACGADVFVQSRRGYGAACAEGAARAEALGADVLLFLDGDGADAAELAERIVGPVRDGQADFVIATRARREPGSMLWHQVLAGYLIGGAAGWVTGVRYRDMAAFRALRPETLHRLGMTQMTYGWNLEMQMRAAAMGLRIVQVDMPYYRRAAGQSKVAGNMRGTLRASARILRTLVTLARELRRRP
jgi:glycosyltransferase involved in cell wall biosynthesis